MTDKSGFTQVFTHSTSPDEKEFIQKFIKDVLPYFIDMSNKLFIELL
jgi:hypothetical protein